MKAIRLLLIEDNQILRKGLMELLSHQKDMTVVGTSDTKEANAILKIVKLKPNVVLLDLSMRSKGSLQLVQILKREFPVAKIILMDISPVPADVIRLAGAGASGFMTREITIDHFLQTIRSVHDGVKIVPPILPDSLFGKLIEYAVKAEKKKRAVSAKQPERAAQRRATKKRDADTGTERGIFKNHP